MKEQEEKNHLENFSPFSLRHRIIWCLLYKRKNALTNIHKHSHIRQTRRERKKNRHAHTYAHSHSQNGSTERRLFFAFLLIFTPKESKPHFSICFFFSLNNSSNIHSMVFIVIMMGLIKLHNKYDMRMFDYYCSNI